MQKQTGLSPRSVLHLVGSLWFGVVLLIVVLLAMASGTLFESQHSAEQSLWMFYGAWFQLLLGLLSLNILASILARYPFSMSKVGFVLTHGSILVLVCGAVVTHLWGVEGQLGFAEGETVSTFAIPENVVSITDTKTGEHRTIDLTAELGAGFSSTDDVDGAPVTMGDITFNAGQYLSDTDYQEVVEEGDADDPHTLPAIRVSLEAGSATESSWLMLGRAARLGPATGLFRLIDNEQLDRLVSTEAPGHRSTLGKVEIDYGGDTIEVDVSEAMKSPRRIGTTDVVVEVLRYLPHANVLPGGQVVSVSPDAVNPAVECVVSIGETRYTRVAFARFPGFKSNHTGTDEAPFELRYVLHKTLEARAPIEILGNGDGDLFVRYSWEGTSPATERVVIGDRIETPWDGKVLVVRESLDRAHVGDKLVEVSPVRDSGVPAIRVTTAGPSGEKSVWVRRRIRTEIERNGSRFRISFGDRIVPLAFHVVLDRFRVGYYPGTRRPRSFES